MIRFQISLIAFCWSLVCLLYSLIKRHGAGIEAFTLITPITLIGLWDVVRYDIGFYMSIGQIEFYWGDA